MRYLYINTIGVDHDWYEVGTSNSPNNINDNIFTQGNVGIGTINPSTQLHIDNIGDATFTLEADNNNVGEDDNPTVHLIQDGGLVDAKFGITGNPGSIYNGALTNSTYLSSTTLGSYALQFVTANTARMNVMGNGNVGINNTNPLNILHLTPTSGGDALRIDNLRLAQTNDTSVLVVNPALGVVRRVSVNSLGQVTGLDHLRDDTLQITQGTNIRKVDLANTMAEVYDVAGGHDLTTAFAVIPFGTSGVVDNNYTSSTSSISVSKAGRYRITYRITAEMVDGNNRSESEYQLTRNNVTVAGTYASGYHRNNINGTATTSVVKVVNLSAGDVIRVEGRKSSGSGDIETKANGSSLLVERL